MGRFDSHKKIANIPIMKKLLFIFFIIPYFHYLKNFFHSNKNQNNLLKICFWFKNPISD